MGRSLVRSRRADGGRYGSLFMKVSQKDEEAVQVEHNTWVRRRDDDDDDRRVKAILREEKRREGLFWAGDEAMNDTTR